MAVGQEHVRHANVPKTEGRVAASSGQDRTRQVFLIAGGGIGGLATALALARYGIASHVLEKRSEYPAEGAGIQIGPNGGRVLAWLGVSEALRTSAGIPDCIRVHKGSSGELLSRLPLGTRIARRHGASYWVLHRADLHAALLEAARSSRFISLSTGADVTGVRQDESTVTVETSDGRSLEGQGLIAADGLWSDLRQQLFDTDAPVFANRSAARAVLPVLDVPKGITTNDVGIWLGTRAHVVHYPVRGGTELALVVVREDIEPAAGWNSKADGPWVRDGVSAFAPVLRELVAAVPAWRKWGLYDLPKPQQLVRGKVALVGDAAHPVLPFLAQGGVMALEDGMTLAQAVATHDNVEAAFAAYQVARRTRVTRVQAASRRNGRIYHLGGAMAAARNMTLRTVPAAILMAQYDWLYGWRPDAC